MTHLRLWAPVGLFGSIVALMIIYQLLGPSVFGFRYADVLGWSTVIVFLLLIIQGFWNRNRQKRGASLIEWGGIHTALSVVVAAFLIVHGFLLLGGLSEPSLFLWLGALAFVILLVLNFSGLATEYARRSRNFGLYRRWHVWLMLFVLVFLVVHVAGEATASSFRSILPGAIIGLASVLFVWLIVPFTIQLIHHNQSLQVH